MDEVVTGPITLWKYDSKLLEYSFAVDSVCHEKDKLIFAFHISSSGLCDDLNVTEECKRLFCVKWSSSITEYSNATFQLQVSLIKLMLGVRQVLFFLTLLKQFWMISCQQRLMFCFSGH